MGKFIFGQTKAAGRQLPPSSIQYGRQTTMSQQMAPTFFYIQAMYLQDIKSNQVYSEVHTQPNWAPRITYLDN